MSEPQTHPMFATEEGKRLIALREDPAWQEFGPYLSERQWGTVREDYSADGNGWAYFPFDDAQARAYRWGEDGLGGFGDRQLHWCLGLALWNGKDPILKERLFGLANGEGNHGEDVKELYYYLDGLPSHAYMRMLYKYPQRAFPYQELRDRNRERDLNDDEYELLDTAVFEEDRYFDVFIEYAKASPDDILLRVSAINRGPEAAELHLLPQCWARNVWAWGEEAHRPKLEALSDTEVAAHHPELEQDFRLYAETGGELLFCDNDTHVQRLFASAPAQAGYFKDGIDACVVQGQRGAVNPERRGSKCAAHHHRQLAAGEEATIRLRFRAARHQGDPFADFDALFERRREETDAFYAAVQANVDDAEARAVQRQALAGLLWSKQFYYFHVYRWLEGDPGQPAPAPERKQGKYAAWEHLYARDLISMPDCWEYPWFAAWDLAFQSIPLALIDPEFAKQQLLLLTYESYMHSNAQLPGYEYDFSDANPPLHAWAAVKVYQLDAALSGKPDRDFLELMFNKLCLNFTWWVNRKDVTQQNLFQGGFLGLDNIALFNRSSPLPPGYVLEQSDGTAWMAFYALGLMRIALILAEDHAMYQHMAVKFFEHFLYIAKAQEGEGGLWDEQDQFFYDRLDTPEGEHIPLRTRSLVGLIPLCAARTLDRALIERPIFAQRLRWFLKHRPDLDALAEADEDVETTSSLLLTMLPQARMRAILARMLDEREFLSPHGIRGVSKFHQEHAYGFERGDYRAELGYWPAESRSAMFGGNSNWRGPVWFPLNYLLIDSLRTLHRHYGDDFTVEYPHGSGQPQNLMQIADHLARRLIGLFLRDGAGQRPVFGDSPREQHDPHFAELVLFYEYFDGDTGRGCGASHQTGWTALVASLIHELAERKVPPRA